MDVSTPEILRVKNLRVAYSERGRIVRAVRGADLNLARGECLGIIGESGCGKSSLGKAILGLTPSESDELTLLSQPVQGLSTGGWKPLRKRAQMVFQDVGGSLSPRMRAGDAVTEPLVVHGLVRGRSERTAAAVRLLKEVGLDETVIGRFPHQLSGGQRQRALIARALATSPEFLIADEPVASLDMSVQMQILELLNGLRSRLSLTMIFISHDIRAVKAFCDRIAVMYAGLIVEIGPADAVMTRMAHPYTRLLASSVPSLDPEHRRLGAAAEDSFDEAGGASCSYYSRCGQREAECARQIPALVEIAPGHLCRCRSRVIGLPPDASL